LKLKCKNSKVIINAYGREAEESFKQVHKRSFFGNKSTS
jgi:hypothetical protein